jgi:hypothetical protein
VHHLGIAALFFDPMQFAPSDPDDRVPPECDTGNPLQQTNPVISAPPMDQFVHDHGATF